MNFIDYLKKLFGNKSQSESDAFAGLVDYYEELKNSYTSDDAASTPSYERKEPDVLSDEQIRDKAKKELEEYYNGNKENIEEEYNQNLKKKQNSKNRLNDQLDTELKRLTESYLKQAEDTKNDTIKQGIARSSIADNLQDSIRDSQKSAVVSLEKEYRYKLDDIDAQIEDLKTKRKSALNDLDISYAAKLADKINSLTKERDKTLEEAMEYNNKMQKQEIEDKKSNSSKSSIDEQELYKNVYLKALEILSDMSPDEARKAVLESETLKELLNDYYYYKLFDKFAN